MTSSTYRDTRYFAAKMDAGSIVVIVGGAVAIVTAFVTGAWQWMSGRKKTDSDAQASLVTGFVALLAEFKSERELLVKRISECETKLHLQDRHISKLERLMIKHNIKIPEDHT